MKAYRCDVCKKYCDDIWDIGGLSEPKTHMIGRFKASDLDCCPECYDKICKFVCDLMDANKNTLTRGM